ncbi:MAG: cytochrome c family protein, partial [Gemmatimonadota bacterium]|nr:cytochrome c family protein [Gemmatimonadota bacterium]
MNVRSGWLAVPGFICIAALATMLSVYSGASSPQGNAPEQPVAFRHTIHVDTLKMSCLYCHFSANRSPDPGLPAVGTCMGCHSVIATGSPEVKKLAAYWNKKEAVPWVRIHKLPEYVHFPHMRHVNAGVTCQTCHGQVQKMTQVYQAASLNMGWCINCHVNGYNAVAGKLAAGYTPTAADSAAPVKRARYDCS